MMYGSMMIYFTRLETISSLFVSTGNSVYLNHVRFAPGRIGCSILQELSPFTTSFSNPNWVKGRHRSCEHLSGVPTSARVDATVSGVNSVFVRPNHFYHTPHHNAFKSSAVNIIFLHNVKYCNAESALSCFLSQTTIVRSAYIVYMKFTRIKQPAMKHDYIMI